MPTTSQMQAAWLDRYNAARSALLSTQPLTKEITMKLTCALADICLPDYWGGHHLPHVCVPVSRDTTFADLREAIIGELWAGAVAGADATPETTYECDAWYHAACEAVERDVQPRDPGVEYPFRHLDSSEDEDSVPVYAYFVFIRED